MWHVRAEVVPLLGRMALGHGGSLLDDARLIELDGHKDGGPSLLVAAELDVAVVRKKRRGSRVGSYW